MAALRSWCSFKLMPSQPPSSILQMLSKHLRILNLKAVSLDDRCPPPHIQRTDGLYFEKDGGRILHFYLASNPSRDQTHPKSSNSAFSCLLWGMRFKFPTLMSQDSVLKKQLYSTSNAPARSAPPILCRNVLRYQKRLQDSLHQREERTVLPSWQASANKKVCDMDAANKSEKSCQF